MAPSPTCLLSLPEIRRALPRDHGINLSIDRLAPGTYVAEVTTADGGRHTVRILKK